VFGAGFGITQNVTQTLMYDRTAESAYGAASAVWNLAYDGGMGLGAASGCSRCIPGTRPGASGRRGNTHHGPFGINSLIRTVPGDGRP
jgi:hypothetical protein